MEEKLKEEVRLGFPISRKWSKKQFDKKLDEMRNKFIVSKDKMKLIVAYCIVNEQEFIEKSLYATIKINDIDAIHILDGGWEHGVNAIQSDDKTFEIVMNFGQKTGIDIIWVKNPHNKLWSSEPEKRNYQLQDIQKRFGGSPYYVLIRDGDEVIRFSTGRNSVWLKKDLVNVCVKRDFFTHPS